MSVLSTSHDLSCHVNPSSSLKTLHNILLIFQPVVLQIGSYGERYRFHQNDTDRPASIFQPQPQPRQVLNEALGIIPPFERIKTEQDLHDIEDVNFHGEYVSIVLIIIIKFGHCIFRLFICPTDLKLSFIELCHS